MSRPSWWQLKALSWEQSGGRESPECPVIPGGGTFPHHSLCLCLQNGLLSSFSHPLLPVPCDQSPGDPHVHDSMCLTLRLSVMLGKRSHTHPDHCSKNRRGEESKETECLAWLLTPNTRSKESRHWMRPSGLQIQPFIGSKLSSQPSMQHVHQLHPPRRTDDEGCAHH